MSNLSQVTDTLSCGATSDVQACGDRVSETSSTLTFSRIEISAAL